MPRSRINVPIVIFTGGIVSPLRSAFSFGILVEIGIPLDGRHPRGEIRSLLKGVERLESPLESILHQILGIIGIVGKLHRLPVQRIDHRHGEFFKTRPFTYRSFRSYFSHSFIVTRLPHAMHIADGRMAVRYPKNRENTKYGFDFGISSTLAQRAWIVARNHPRRRLDA